MGENRNNLSTKIGRKIVKESKNSKEQGNRVTRASLKRSGSELSCDEQPLPKQTKAVKSAKQVKGKKLKKHDELINSQSAKVSKRGANTPNEDIPQPVVATAKSLIASIKNGTLSRADNVSPKTKTKVVAAAKPQWW